MVILLVLNFIFIGTYSVAVSIPQDEYITDYSNITSNNTLNQSAENNTEDELNTDESTDFSQERSTRTPQNRRNVISDSSDQTDTNYPEPETPEEPPIENPEVPN
jgi:hypothetical protein